MTLDSLQPQDVFHYFREIAAIPRPSYHEKAVSDYLVDFAKAHGLFYVQDDLYNVVIIREAAPGCEGSEPLILQGHMDMVCEKEADCAKDMEKEGLDLVLDGDLLSAEGTTLGGDDGIAVAYMLALLADETLRCPRLECVFTVSEEVGMEGAAGLDTSILRGHRLLNLDSEDEGILLSSCAGGGRIDISLPVKRGPMEGENVLVSVEGLSGGHSGGEIHKGGANGPLAAARILAQAAQDGARFALVSIDGGEKDNAIPRGAEAVVRVLEDELAFVSRIERFAAEAAAEYAVSDPGFAVHVYLAPEDGMLPMTEADTRRALALMLSLPNGVVRMSDRIPGLVETSLNLGIAKTAETELSLSYAPRSSVTSAFDALCSRMQLTAESLGADYVLRSRYPAWEYRADSVLRPVVCGAYRAATGKEMKVEAIHAGLECGIFAGKIADLDAVSIGPDMWDIHTPKERLSVSSAARTYAFVRDVIETLAKTGA